MPDFSNDLLQMLRLQNAFAPEQMVGGNPPPPTPTMNTQIFQPPTAAPEVDPVSRFLQMYQPEDTYMNQAAGMLGQIPERPKPELWRKILGSVVAGLTQSIPAGRDVIERPYREKLADWKTKYEPTAEVAKMEQTRNTAERMAAYNAASAQNAARRSDIYAQSVEERARTAQQRMEIERQKLQLLDWKTKHPNMVFKSGDDGYIYGLDPQTGKSFKTDVMGSDLNELEKYELLHEMRMEEIGARGAESRKTEELRQKDAERRIEVGKWTIVNITDPKTGKTVSKRLNTVTGQTADIEGGTVEKPAVTGATERARISAAGQAKGAEGESANQTKIRLYNRAQEAYNTHPEWRDFIQLHEKGTNEFDIYPPRGGVLGFGKRDSEVHRQIIEFIYGKGGAPTAKAATGPKVGDTKTFPNGKRGRWDGKGWVLIK